MHVTLALGLCLVLASADPHPLASTHKWKSPGSPRMHTDAMVLSYQPHFSDLVPPGSTVEVLARGFAWSEGPVFIDAWENTTIKDMLLFSDVKRNTIYSWTEEAGLNVFLHPSGCNDDLLLEQHRQVKACASLTEPGSNGLAFHHLLQGLVIAQHGNRQIIMLRADNTTVVLASHYNGKRLNSPNDITIG